MGDGSVSPNGPEPPVLEELEELVEPLEAPPLPEPLSVDAVVAGPDETSFRILTWLKTESQVNFYEATVEDGAPTFWLHEALSETAAARLRHEAQVLEGLDGPMFPHALACFESDGKTYLVTEPLAGTTLADALADGSLSLPQTLSVLAQVAFALTRLHAHGWAHLGLRPEVVLLGKPVKILDFSYATRLGEKPPAPFYHAGYSPPELLTEEPVDARADVYAVGALLFHAVNGQPMAETGAELSVWEPPTPIAGVPQILHRCLGSREMRYATMEELHRDLLRLRNRYEPTGNYSLATATTIGLEPTRVTNQDAHGYLTGRMESEKGAQAWAVVCVADGMGGMAAGEVASEVAVKTVMTEAAAAFASGRAISAEEQVRIVKQWAHAANDKVCTALEARRARGGTTLVCACVVDRRLTIAHVGDCRLYLLRESEVTPLTRDHSLAMALALQGEITMEEVRHHPDRSKVSRSLGDRQPLPDYFADTLEQATDNPTMELQAGDVLLLCSDGLWEPVLEEEMFSAVRDHAPDLNTAAEVLLKIALQRGAPDNATVALLRMDETDPVGNGCHPGGPRFR